MFLRPPALVLGSLSLALAAGSVETTAATLRGEVSGPDGEAVYATVRVLVDPAGTDPVPEVLASDDRGRFELDVPAGSSCRLRIESGGLQPRNLDVAPGEGPLEVRLDSGRTVRGRVVDLRAGQGVDAATVWACDDGAAAFGFAACIEHRADAEGRFRIDGAPDEAFRLVASSPEHAFGEVRVRHGTSERDFFRIDLRPGEPLRGRVVDGRGEPLAGVRIGRDDRLRAFADRAKPAFDPPLITDQNGEFLHPGIPRDADGAIRGMLDGWYGEPVNLLATRGLSEPLELKMERPAALQFGLRDARGEPLFAEVRLVQQTPGAIDGPAGTAADDGRYRFAGLPTRPLELTLVVAGHVPLALGEVPFRPGGTIDLGELTAVRGITLRGTVTDTDGARVGEGWVRVDHRRPARHTTSVPLEGGGFRFEGLPAGTELTLRVDAPGYEPLLESVSYSDDARWDPVLTPQATVRGTVRVPGGAAATRFEARLSFQERPSTSQVALDVEDPDGRFSFDGVRPPGTYTLEVGTPGYRTATVPDIVVGERQWVDVGEVELARGQTLTGVAWGPDGAPAVGARVAVVTRVGGTAVRPVRPDTAHSGTADAEGRFAVEGLSPGLLAVDATHPDFAPWSGEVRLVEEVERESLRIEFSEGGIVHGHARDRSGGPVPGIQVAAECARLPAQRTNRTDEGGYYRLARLPAGACRVWAFREDGTPFGNPRLVTLAEGHESLADFDLSSSIEVSGTLRMGGEPVERGYLTFLAAGGFAVGGVATVPVEPGSGRYRVELSEPGEYRVRLESGGAKTMERVVVPEQEVVRRDFDIPANWILGRVVDADGIPVSQAEVVGSSEGLDLAERTGAFTRSDGGFDLRNLRSGLYTITATRQGFGRARTEPIEVRPDTRIDGLELVLRDAPLRIAGRFLDPGGNGIRDGFVIVAPVGTRRLEFANHATTRADGTFEIDVPGEGPLDVTALSAEWAAARLSAYVPDGETPLLLQAGRGGHLTIRVTDRNGEPLEGVSLAVVPDPDWLASSALSELRVPPVTGPDGIAHAHFLTEGTYRVSAPGGVTTLATVYDGQTAETELRVE